MTARMIVVALALATSVSLTAAQTGARDSAGVRIIENPARAGAPALLKLGAKPSFDVGGLEDKPENEFESKQGYLRGARLSTGGLAVIDVVRVQYFDAAGKRVRISGRKGQGPGEMLYVTSVCRTRGDTIVVSDSHNSRVAVFDESGKPVRTIPFGELGSMPFNACLDDGTFLLEHQLPGARGTPRDMRITRLHLDGTVANVIGTYTIPPVDMATFFEASFVGAGQHLYVASGASSEVRVFNLDGKLATIVRTADPVSRISASEIESRLGMTIPGNVSADERKQRMEQMRALPHSETWPPYRRMQVDAAGRIWLEDFAQKYPAENIWTAFDVNGRMVGRLALPAPKPNARAFEVIAFGKDDILVRRWDDDGANHLTIYPIVGLPSNGR